MMVTAYLGAPNTGKTTAAAAQRGCLHMPVFWARIACHRRDRTALWGRCWHDLLDPAAFTIGATYPPSGERALIAALCGGRTDLQQAEPDMALAAHLFCVVKKRWRKLKRPIYAEGELLNKDAWLRALNPDRVCGMFIAPRHGLVTTQRRKGLHPPGEWDDAMYLARQAAVHDVIGRWLKGAP